jgi:hypothetical protein
VITIDELVDPVQTKLSSLGREIKRLPLDDYNVDLDGEDWLLEGEYRELLDEDVPLEASPLGLNAKERYNARQRAVRAALLGYRHRGSIHYTQGQRRWEWWRDKEHAAEGQYPSYADCSAFATWCLWDATRIHRLGDFVNGYGWRAGFTGTQVRHGTSVRLSSLLTADLIFYGGPYYRPRHVAIYVGNGRVISHGSEVGPVLLKYNYRDINHARRYIR